MHRVLLIEFAAVDRFHRALSFPYLLGFLRARGVAARWLRLGVRAAVQYVRHERGVGLDEADAAALVEAARAFAPTDLVFGHAPAAELLGRVHAAAPEARLWMSEDAAFGAGPEGLRELRWDARAWSDLVSGAPSGSAGRDAAGEPRREEGALPDFSFEPLNAAARTMQPLPFLVLGEECTYDRPLSLNPLFAGVDLTGCVRTGGCTFCTKPPAAQPVHRASVEEVRAQLEALRRTLPPPPGRLSVRLLGEPALRHLEAIVAAVRELGFPPSDLLLDTRADRLVAREQSFARAAKALEGTGHRLQVALIGIENFARAELERMNKGTTPETNLDAVVTLLRLEHDHPETFAFREHGGLSLILFSPWTTLEDLAFNLRVVRACGLEGMSGKVLTSRLRLMPELPLTPLARRDGLLVERYADPAFDTAARNLYGEEIPWRFADPRLEPLCAVFVRLAGDTPFGPDDPHAARVRALQAGAASRGLTSLDVAVELVEEALLAAPAPEAAGDAGGAGSGPPTGDEKRSGAEEKPGYVAGAHEEWLPPVEEAIAQDDKALLVALTRAGVKPVTKFEPVRPSDVEGWSKAGHLGALRARRRRSAGPEAYDVLFGRSAADVERAVALTGVIEVATDQAEIARAIGEVGRLLGYAGRCADAFAAESAQARQSSAWAHLARRVAHPGAVPLELNPFTGLLTGQFVPCSLGCERAVEVERRAHAVLRELQGETALEALLRRAANPWLVVLDGQGQASELVAEGTPGERFRFSPGSSDGLPGAARGGDELVLDGERLLVLARGRPVADLSASAFVWWHERPLQAAFWQRLLTVRGYQTEWKRRVYGERWSDARAAETQGGGPPGIDPEIAKLAAQLGESLARAGAARVLPAGAALEPIAIERGRAMLRVRAGEQLVELFVTPSAKTERSFARAGPYAFTYPKERPVQSPWQVAVVRTLVQVLTRQARS